MTLLPLSPTLPHCPLTLETHRSVESSHALVSATTVMQNFRSGSYIFNPQSQFNIQICILLAYYVGLGGGYFALVTQGTL